jgi:hypothetical protein
MSRNPATGFIAAALCLVTIAATTTRIAPVRAEPPAANQVALDWNLNAVNAVRAAATTIDGPSRPVFQVEGLIYLSYVQAAVYDAVTKIAGRYVPYHDFSTNAAAASPQAAIIAAAYNTLLAYLGDPDGSLAAKYSAAIAALPDAGKAQGIAVGQAAAADIVALRAHDGRGAPAAVYGTPGPVTAGAWQVVPPSTTAQTPWVAFMKPFMLDSASQFRLGPPPAPGSEKFAADFNETKAYGAKYSTVRTPEQTAVAYFWNANVINQYNQVFRQVAAQTGMDLVDTVHLLAMGEMVETDAGIACFDAKYHYLFWRPYTAIRNAGLAGNARTEADPNWVPLLSTPNHPEYPAAHGCLTAALGEILAATLHTQHINIDLPGAANGGTTLAATRHFDTVADLDREIVNARVWIGFHYRNSAEVGVDLGKDVAKWTMQRYFGSVGSVSAAANSFTVNFASASPGVGRVYFGSGPGCRGLVEVATQDRLPGTTLHSVTVNGNDLPGTVGDNGIQPGTTYWYETATSARSGEQIDDNGGRCYHVTTLPTPGA